MSRVFRQSRPSRLSAGSAIVAESCGLRLNSGLFDKRVSHEPGVSQTDGRDREVVFECPYRKIHIFDFAVLAQ